MISLTWCWNIFSLLCVASRHTNTIVCTERPPAKTYCIISEIEKVGGICKSCYLSDQTKKESKYLKIDIWCLMTNVKQHTMEQILHLLWLCQSVGRLFICYTMEKVLCCTYFRFSHHALFWCSKISEFLLHTCLLVSRMVCLWCMMTFVGNRIALLWNGTSQFLTWCDW